MEKKKQENNTNKNRDKEPLQVIEELGKLYFLNNKYEEAIKEFNKVIKLDPQNVDAYYNLGLCYESLSDIDTAKQFYQRVLSLDPHHKLAKEHLNKILNV